MNGKPQFALNHMCAPSLGVSEFLDLARSLDVSAVEIRNDIPGQAILDGTKPGAIREAAEERGLRIISINALQRFNDWSEERADEARRLIDFCAACGAEGLVLVPVNDGIGRSDGERQANLLVALKALLPLLASAGVRGLVEPLGFETCSLRFKSEAADAVRSIDARSTLAVVHDTFHHHLTGEPDLFPEVTGLVHISGVTDATLRVSEMRDGHRVLVDKHDRLGNVEQLRSLMAAGYSGALSFEPFSPAVHRAQDLAGDLRRSMEFIREGLGPSGD